MKFRVSSGLKSIIGKDLITDDFVAIFELVKNAFDAYSDRVDIYFDENEICIIDNGKGMTKEDLINKWLFVAYSAKHDNTEDSALRSDYRSELRSRRNTFAGNKGVGRFSCDRLGERLTLQTKSIDDNKVNVIDLNWSNFEIDDKKEFTDINVDFHQDDQFYLPEGLAKKLSIETGTVLIITSLREADSWDRKKLLNLKSSIAKLIDPFGIKDDFDVYLHVPRELINDSVEIKKLSSEIDFDSPYTNIVNGRVRNLIFTKLASKTTKIKVSVIADDPDFIRTELIDRGECVYEIKEPNSYSKLKHVNLDIDLYFMNTAAKNNFTRTMGIENKNFGSVFLFNNGFRVFPIGEPSNDEFRINFRKSQGYNRYLGTRELLGMIDVNGRPEDFKEASSRDKGLINTPAYSELVELFLRKALIRLESYVVNVSWQDKFDGDVSDISRVLSDQGKTRVAEVLSKLISGKNVELIRYSEKLIDTISIRNNSFEENINHLSVLADKTGSKVLKEKVELALIQYNELQKAELESRFIAENERKIREAAEAVAIKETERRKEAQRNLELISIAFEDEKKRNLFLKNVWSAPYLQA
ncbi:ATP-binding protein [Aeromonas caviae]|uniref:ATP-binding protein n=1 Tax=Aeromonas caviae TaxID=648 RepID=UPI001921F9E3|nr:ATP-binding protein [Aeromonas caviae]MBL0580070.1 ATP-binding protein [Aeromonas caviae]